MTRLARSVQNLGNEVHERWPKNTLYYYDDTSKRDSDHDPNPAGVVCAIDIMAGHGLNLAALAEQILARRHPALKYIIYNRRIASARTGWKWVEYTGSNPHTDHIHVSVGVGSDGYSTGPYDNTEPWLTGGGEMELTDKINLVVGKGVDYSSPTTTVAGVLASTNYYVLQTRNLVSAKAAEDETRDKALLALVQSLTSGSGNVDTAPVIAAIREATAQTNTIVAGLQAEIAALHAEIDERDQRLALAYGEPS